MDTLGFISQPISSVIGGNNSSGNGGNFTLPGLEPNNSNPTKSITTPNPQAQNGLNSVIESAKTIGPAIAKSVTEPAGNLVGISSDKAVPGKSPIVDTTQAALKLLDNVFGIPGSVAGAKMNSEQSNPVPGGFTDQVGQATQAVLAKLGASESLSKAGGNVAGFAAGMVEPLGGEGLLSDSAAEEIAKSADGANGGHISQVLQKEIPTLNPENADILAKPLAHVNDPNDVQHLLNEISMRSKNASLKTVTPITEEDTQKALDFIKQPIKDVMAPKVEAPNIKSFLKEPINDIVSSQQKPIDNQLTTKQKPIVNSDPLSSLKEEVSNYKTAAEAYDGFQKQIDDEIDREIAKGTPENEAINTPEVNKLYAKRNEFARIDMQSFKDNLSKNIPASDKIKDSIIKHDLGFMENANLGDIWDHIQSKTKSFLDPEKEKEVKTGIVSQLLQEKNLDEGVFGPRSGLTEKGQADLKKELTQKSNDIYDSVKQTLLDQDTKTLSEYTQATKEAPTSLPEKSDTSEVQKSPQSELMEKAQDLHETRTAKNILKESLEANPARQLKKYISQSTARLPELTGKETMISANTKKETANSEFGRKGDDIVKSLGFKDVDHAQEELDKYLKQEKGLNDLKDLVAKKSKAITNLNLEDKDAKSLGYFLRKSFKENGVEVHPAASLEDAVKNGYNEETTKENGLVTPPEVRGGIKAPELNWTKWKSSNKRFSTMLLNRDTMERNIEKLAPRSDAQKLKDFLIDPISHNETELVKARNKSLLDTRAKMKNLKIRSGTNDSALVQKLGEDQATIDQVRAESKNVENIQKAIEYFRGEYEKLIDQWNEKRAEFGYKPVGKQKNYFRHFQDIDWFTKTFGFLKRPGDLPTSIAGETEFFKPGKPFTTAEMHRTGFKTSFDAVKGFENYAKSVYKQIYHIDSIQRGRALEKYINEVAKTLEAKGSGLPLAAFKENLQNYVNQLAGKQSKLDRSIEGYVGRANISTLEKFNNLVIKNVIGGNLSAALSHLLTIPANMSTVNAISFVKGGMETAISPLRSDPFHMINGQESSLLLRRYPVEKINNDFWSSAENTLNFVMNSADKFKTKLAVTSKYYEGVSAGMSKGSAMKVADNYGSKIVGDYSTGRQPAIFNTKLLKLISPFQMGLNDTYSVLVHDIPYSNAEKTASWARNLGQWLSYAIGAYLFNKYVYTKATGAQKGINPLEWLLDISGYGADVQGQDLSQRLETTLGAIFSELPFSSLASGNNPTGTELKNIGIDLGTLWTNGTNLGNDVNPLLSLIEELNPVGGGSQIKKMISAIQSYQAGQYVSASGKTTTPIAKTSNNLIRGLIFGPSGFPEVQQSNKNANNYFNQQTSMVTARTAVEKAFLPTYQAIRAQLASGDKAGATKAWNALSVADKKTYALLKKNEATKATIAREKAIYPTVVKLRGMMDSEDPTQVKQAYAKYNALSLSDRKAYDSVKTRFFGGSTSKSSSGFSPSTIPNKNGATVDATGTPKFAENVTAKPSNIIDEAVLYAKAIGTDPITAFSRIFTGQQIIRVDNPGFLNPDAAVVVQRFPLASSEAVRNQDQQSENLSEDQMKGLQLDHFIPLEAGGTNEKYNLDLITTEQNEVDNAKVEAPIAQALEEGQISREKATEYITRYKIGTLNEVPNQHYLDLYKNKYNSQPLTADQVVDLINSGKSK